MTGHYVVGKVKTESLRVAMELSEMTGLPIKENGAAGHPPVPIARSVGDNFRQPRWTNAEKAAIHSRGLSLGIKRG